MSIEEIRALKKRFENSASANEKAETSLRALHLLNYFLRKEIGWAIDYRAAWILAAANKQPAPNDIPADILQKTEGADAELKREMLSQLLIMFPGRIFDSSISLEDKREVLSQALAGGPRSIFLELGDALRAANNGEKPPLLIPKRKMRLGTVKLDLWQSYAAIFIAYYSGRGDSPRKALERVASAYDVKPWTLEEWRKKSKRSWQVNNEEIDRWKEVALEAGKKYQTLRKKKPKLGVPKPDSNEYGEHALKEFGEHYQKLIKGITAERKLKSS
jgi:hypothetical protein